MKTKRKIIKQGKNTLTLTLPKEWTEKLGLEPGHELDLETRDNLLILKGKQNGNLARSTIQTSGMNFRTLEGTLITMYKLGYDEIEVAFDDPSVIKVVQTLVKNMFMGFEIIEQSNKRCLIKNILLEQEDQFDTLLRKIFLTVNALADNTLELVQTKKYASLSELKILDETSNKLIYMCHRMLYRNGFREYKKTIPLYIILFHYDRIAYAYLSICKYLSDPKHKNLTIGKDTLELFKLCTQMYRNFYELFYKFDLEKMNAISEDMYRLEDEAIRLMKIRPPAERPVLAYFVKLSQFMNNMLSSRMALTLC